MPDSDHCTIFKVYIKFTILFLVVGTPINSQNSFHFYSRDKSVLFCAVLCIMEGILIICEIKKSAVEPDETVLENCQVGGLDVISLNDNEYIFGFYFERT